MWANSVWGLLGLSVTFGLAMLAPLPPEYAWLLPWFGRASVACGVGSVIVLCWPLRRKENRAKVRQAFHHPIKWIQQNLESRHLIVVGLIGVIAFAAVALVGVIWQGRATSKPDISAITQPLQDKIDSLKRQLAATDSQKTPATTPPLFSTEDISKMLVALGKMQTIVGTQVRNAYEATQFVSLRDLITRGAPALVAKLQPIRDAMRQANKDLTNLLFEYRYYDSELRPVVAGYDSALGWMDGSITPIIDDLNKYSSGNPDVLEALVRDRFVEWANGRSSQFDKWYGGAESRIAAETKRIREWPRIVDVGPVITQPAQGPTSIFAPEPRKTTIEWNQSFGTTRAVDLVFAVFLDGKGPPSKSVKLTDAYLQSGTTGEIIKMKIGSTNPLEDTFPISEANPIPPGAFIRLVAVMNPSAPNQGLPNKKFWDDWKQIWFHAVYDDDKPDDILFDEKVIGAYFPEISGPHVTRKSDVEKK